MFKSLFVFLVGAAIVFVLCYFRYEVADGTKKARYRASAIENIAIGIAVIFAFALLIFGGNTLIRFADKYVLQAGDSPVWSLFLVAPFIAMMMACLAYMLLTIVGQIAYKIRRDRNRRKNNR